MTNLSHCTAQINMGKFCDAPSIPGAPFPICISHAAALVRYVSQVAETSGATEVTSTLDLMRRFNVCIGTADFVWPDAPTAEPPVVYYLRLGDHVKIGTTVDLRKRMMVYPPRTLLLATEPGNRVTENIRHAEFAHLRVPGPRREWFRDAPELQSLVRHLVQKHGHSPV